MRPQLHSDRSPWNELHEDYLSSVRGECRNSLTDGRSICNPHRIAPVGIHLIDLVVAVPVSNEDDSFAIRRIPCAAVRCRVLSQVYRRGVERAHSINLGAAVTITREKQ